MVEIVRVTSVKIHASLTITGNFTWEHFKFEWQACGTVISFTIFTVWPCNVYLCIGVNVLCKIQCILREEIIAMSKSINFNIYETVIHRTWERFDDVCAGALNETHKPEVKVVWSTMVKTQSSMKHERNGPQGLRQNHSLDIRLRTYTHSRVGKTSQ